MRPIWWHARQPLRAYHSVVADGVVFPSLLYRLMRAGESRLAKLPVDIVVGFTHPGTESVAGLSRRRRLADVVLYRSSNSNTHQGQVSRPGQLPDDPMMRCTAELLLPLLHCLLLLLLLLYW